MPLSGLTGRVSSSGSVAPLYKRLPHGPHRLNHTEVIRHQRTRIHGAMVEAVAVGGYEGTSVKQVVGLAGVSRRSFYEQFANREECFLATFDLIAARGAARVSEAYRTTEGDLEDRLRAAFGQFAEAVTTNSKSAGLAIVEARTAGTAGMLRLCRAMATFEQMLWKSFARTPGATPLPVPVVRGIVGGLYEATSMRLREGDALEIPALTEEMLSWTLLFQTPATQRVTAHLTARVPNGEAFGHSPDRVGTSTQDDRERLLENALRLAVVDDYRELSAPQIAAAADVPMDAFFELFAGKHECFLAALDMLGDELLLLVAEPDLVSSDWPRAVRRVIGELMRYLADHPLYAQMVAVEAFAAGPDAIERNLELAHDIATRLTEGAPEKAQSRLILERVVGVIWHTIRCQVTGGRIQLLPALSDYLAYVVLAPLIGADAAAAVVTEAASGSCPRGARRSA